uniref:Uncharacterized protein n=1 Tax=Arundo donax TaxID=35708 RepID=A0A0A9ANX0_ARUDO
MQPHKKSKEFRLEGTKYSLSKNKHMHKETCVPSF